MSASTQLRSVAALLTAAALATSLSGCAMAVRALTLAEGVSALHDLAESPALVTGQRGLVEAVVTGTGGEGLWLREQPGAEPLTVLPDGTEVVVDCQTDGPTVEGSMGRTSVWSHVRTPEGDRGYMSNGYLDVDPGAPVC